MKKLLQPTTYKLKATRGMTFIELIVVIGIFATISGVVLFNFTGFTTNISLQNLANQIALQLKKAQTEALSGRGGTALFSGLDPSNKPVKPSYGIYFDSDPAKNDKFDYVADLDNDGKELSNIICNPTAECQNQITIQTGDRINKLCVNKGATCTASSNLTVTFKRPFPDANFYYSDSGVSTISDAQIEIISPKGFKKTIIVWSTGQIEVYNGSIFSKFPSCSPSCL